MPLIRRDFHALLAFLVAVPSALGKDDFLLA